MGENGLDMHSVTDLLLADKGSSIEILNPDKKEDRERLYAEQIAKVLSQCEYSDTGLAGGVIKIYNPVLEDKAVTDVAVKFLDLSEANSKIRLRLAKELPDEVVDSILADHGFLVSLNHEKFLNKGVLSSDELLLVQLAYEHRLYEKYFGEYVLPSLFLTFPLREDIRNRDGALFKKKGDVVALSVQDFEGKIRSIGTDQSNHKDFTDWDTLTEQEVNNLEAFADRLEEVFSQTGFYPDDYLLERGNLGMLEDGRVILLDTNVMHQIKDMNKVGRIVEMAHRRDRTGVAVGIMQPIAVLRSKIDKYRKKRNLLN